ncbi:MULTISPECIES: peptidylprolyl isomerase [Ramlibacter]|uniref:Chaperone SurA n=1 Tax=Ramlibacter aquaticus TaxID=2780094 RepID=A0ABR9SJH8_9BURK|nr:MULTISPECIES: peptidylprolyl isomerase [Ramlibacter]MBE7941912.1 peptidylprolyl isomerase [Ramlibacter aquaticus]
MNTRALVLWLAALLCAVAAPLPASAQATRQADYIVAVVNSEPITNYEVRARAERFAQQLAQQGQAIPPSDVFLRQVLERLINERAQIQLAKENGIKVDEAQVDQAEQNIARRNGLEVPELRRRMQADGIAPAKFREDLRNQLLLQRQREREFDNRVRVNDLELDQFIAEQKAAAADPSSAALDLAQILVAVPENATDAQVQSLKAKAQRALDRARAGEDFAKLAREFSDAPGAATNGGAMGLRPPDRLPSLFVDAVRKVPDGGVSDIVRSGAGFHILKVLERQGGGLPTTVVQSHARHILLRVTPQLSEAQALRQLADFKRRIQQGQADFAQLAKEYSQDGSARNGGDLGWANPGLFVPEFEEALDSLAPGQIADPVISRFGVHLIQLLERRRAPLTPAEQREIARNMLREKKIEEAYTTWAQETRGRAYVEYRDPPQ